MRSRLAELAPPIDSVHTALDDEAGLTAEARHAAALGFYGKSVIHPRQIAAVHEVFTPSESAIVDAERILVAAAEAEERGVGALQIGGRFVDAAIVARARVVLDQGRNR